LSETVGGNISSENKIFLYIKLVFSEKKGGSPVIISYKRIPSDHQSTALPMIL